MPQTTAIILAAGHGTRMKSKRSKVLHRIDNKPLIDFALSLCKQNKIQNIVVVVSKNASELTNHLKSFKEVTLAIQDPPLGTGHAVMAGIKKVKRNSDHILIMTADMPLIQKETISQLLKTHYQRKK